ncbi:MAG: molecular chaperone TorD family protein [Deltaproteobacteria bacterium]|nr:molecular chaperone TorD family protein [Deltaproteobacteria bacterium]
MAECGGNGLPGMGGDVAPLLARASLYRFLSMAFQRPAPGLAAELNALSDLVPDAFRERTRRVVSLAAPDLEPTYHRTLGAGGTCRSCETDVLPAAGGKGQVLADIAGFYRAFLYDPSREQAESPDHVAAELGFLAWLAFKEAYAAGRGADDEASVCHDAAGKFLADHLGAWAPVLAGCLAGAAVPFYRAAGELLHLVATPNHRLGPDDQPTT